MNAAQGIYTQNTQTGRFRIFPIDAYRTEWQTAKVRRGFSGLAGKSPADFQIRYPPPPR